MSFHCRVFRNVSKGASGDGPVVATLGNFDGLHAGHQALLHAVTRWKAQTPQAIAVAITFYPHPATVLGKAPALAKLSSLKLRLEVLSQLGVDALIPLHFTKAFSHMKAAEFIEQVLFQRIGVRHLVIGPDAHVGYQRQGTPQFLKDYFERSGRSAEIVSFVEHAGERISSRRIREVLSSGDLPLAEALLGRPYSVDGHVVRGDGRGRTIGVPTANVHPGKQMLPRNGVYAGTLELPSGTYGAVANIGVRPTFGGERRVLEVHAWGYQGEPFYGSRVRFRFSRRLRDERRFDSVDALVKQIHSDIALAQRVMSKELQ